MEPRTERLHKEFERMKKLVSESSLIKIATNGDPPEQYQLIFKGKGLMLQGDRVEETTRHEALIDLGADWPQKAPLIFWRTPLFHPNIRVPNVCVLGHPYSITTHLDTICETLWDMLTYKSYNVNSPLDKQAAKWVCQELRQNSKRFPVDDRELRDQAVVIRIKK